MAGRGRRMMFHGAFATKAAAVAKEREVGGFIRETSIRGQRRYMVLTQAAPIRRGPTLREVKRGEWFYSGSTPKENPGGGGSILLWAAAAFGVYLLLRGGGERQSWT